MGDWWLDTQDQLPAGATFVPVICTSNKTHWTNVLGAHHGWPLYHTIGIIANDIRRTPEQHAWILVGLIPCPPKGAKNTDKASSAKNISVWADWLRQSGRAPSEPSETPRWRITPRPASIPRVELHIALRSPFRRFFSLCRSPTLNKHSGIVANCDHTSEWVHCVHACIGIPMHKDPRNCADPRNLAKSE